LGTTAVLDLAEVLARLKGETKSHAITIGRSHDNTVVIDNPRVSSHHAVIEQSGAECVLRDLDSTNGTYVNGQKIAAPTILAHGSLVRFGQEGPTYVFPDTFGIKMNGGGHAAVGAGSQPHNAAAGDLRRSVILPIASQRTVMWRSPNVWAGLVVLIVMCRLFTYTGNELAYNSYIYLFGLLSCAAVLWFIYRLCGKRQPWWYLVAPAVFTAISTWPAVVLLHALLGQTTSGPNIGFVQRLLEETFITGVIEEFTKILPVLLVLLLTRTRWAKQHGIRFDEPLDGILLASSSAIGFVVLETILSYCNPQNVTTYQEAWLALQLLIPRIFASVGGHVAYSGYFGYFVGLAILHKQRFWPLILMGYGSAAFCHGLWNSVGGYGTPLMILASSTAYLLFMAAIFRARALSPSKLRHTVYNVEQRQD
jgi:RsiW-degrading membrane proteinase PrsW (M82 family)